jgi:hypothetical protein
MMALDDGLEEELYNKLYVELGDEVVVASVYVL